MSDQKISDLTALAAASAAAVDLVPVVDVSATETKSITLASLLDGLLRVGGPGSLAACGRLTLLSGTPIPTADQTAKTTVYFTPYLGSLLALYYGGLWGCFAFAEVSVAVPATTSTPFDVFAYWTGSAIALETANWTNGTTRSTTLTLQNGVLVKTGDATRRYLGTCCTTSSSGQCEDSIRKRLVFNQYSRVLRNLKVSDSTSHAYTSATVRPWNNDATLNVQWIVGQAMAVTLGISAQLVSYGQAFIGYDSTTATIDNFSGVYEGNVVDSQPAASYPLDTVEGLHTAYILEGGAGSVSAHQYRAQLWSQITM